jgi:hypothetical protein
LRPDPLRRLGLDRIRSRTDAPGGAAVTGRSSRSRPSAVADAAVDEALRDVSTAAGDRLPDRWRERLHDVATARRHDVADALDVAVASAELPTGSPRWWSIVAGAQWVSTAVMVVGLLWLLVIGVVAWFRLPDLPTPDIGPFTWPTALALGGAAAGLIIAVIARRAASVGGRRRAERARRALRQRTGEVAGRLVIEPVDAELAVLARLQQLVRRLDR